MTRKTWTSWRTELATVLASMASQIGKPEFWKVDYPSYVTILYSTRIWSAWVARARGLWAMVHTVQHTGQGWGQRCGTDASSSRRHYNGCHIGTCTIRTGMIDGLHIETTALRRKVEQLHKCFGVFEKVQYGEQSTPGSAERLVRNQ